MVDENLQIMFDFIYLNLEYLLGLSNKIPSFIKEDIKKTERALNNLKHRRFIYQMKNRRNYTKDLDVLKKSNPIAYKNIIDELKCQGPKVFPSIFELGP